MTTIIDEENDPVEQEYAAPMKRIFVVLIDVVNCWILAYLASFVFTNTYERPLYIACISVLLIYKVIAEKRGWQSFGKMMYRLEVRLADGTAPGWQHVIRRNSLWLLLIAAYALYFYVLIPRFGADFISMPIVFSLISVHDIFKVGLLVIALDMAFVFFTPQQQAFHDIIADTVVLDKN